MALVHSIISVDANLVLTREIGTTTRQDLIETHRQILVNRQLGKHVRILVALHTVVEGVVTADDMAECVPFQQQIMEQRGACRVAMYAPNNLAYGLSRMFKSYAESSGHLYGIFETLDECLEWLQVSDEEDAEIRRRLAESEVPPPSTDLAPSEPAPKKPSPD